MKNKAKTVEDLNKIVLDNMIIGISIISPKMEIIWINKTLRKQFPNIDVTKKPLCYQAFYSPPKKKICNYCPTIKAFKTGEVHSSETDVCSDGKIYNVVAAPVKEESGKTNYVIETIEDITARKKAEEALQKAKEDLEICVKKQTSELNESNTALKVLLKQCEKNKEELESNILSNVKNLILPYIEKLKKNRSMSKELAYLNILESNLKEIVSPFSAKLSSKYLGFTPKEIQIADLIKEGQKDKDIMEILSLSLETVKTHRQNIRKKLGIYGKRANLRTHLLSIVE